jgi:hypothetical protein
MARQRDARRAVTVIAKGQPPEDLLGILWLWWRTPVIGWDGITWGTLIVCLAVPAVVYLINHGGGDS